MKFVSWNVNGLRSVCQKGFVDFIRAENPDFICLQEIKAMQNQVGEEVFEGYHVVWNSAAKKGYSGTLLASKEKPLDVKFGIDFTDEEGRVIAARFHDFWLVNVYTPNSGRDLARLSFRELEWDPRFLSFLKDLEKEAPVIFCGDLNTAHTEKDLANPKTNTKNAGFTLEERKGLNNLVSNGFVDSFRAFNPQAENRYTWWSYRPGIRERNIGWRIDYFFTSASLSTKIAKADILERVLGSDHCPITLEVMS